MEYDYTLKHDMNKPEEDQTSSSIKPLRVSPNNIVHKCVTGRTLKAKKVLMSQV